jgi:hypothetical protein
MSDLAAPGDRLQRAEQACRNIPMTLPPAEYKRRLDAAMDEWRQANVALFDAQVAPLNAEWDRIMARAEAQGW